LTRYSQRVAPSKDWLLTIRQSAVRIPRLWSQLDPTFHLPSVASIDSDFVQQENIRGFIWDVDGTLMGCRHNRVAPDLQDAVATLFARSGTRHVILSNCAEDRFLELGRIFPTAPILRGYLTPRGPACRRLVGQDDQRDPRIENTAQLQPIRKPSAILVEFALRELALPPSQVVVVGDQYLTDIAGANATGVRSIKVLTSLRSPSRQPFDSSS
jgi:HAD superfamily phosphatase (TIGR01668 family)